MDDPHNELAHPGMPTYPRPFTATLGQEWVCPECGRVYLAVVPGDRNPETFKWLYLG